MAIAARYPATCASCGAAIVPGDQIASAGGGGASRWAHDACPDPSPIAAADAPVLLDVSGDDLDGLASATTTEVWTDGACSGNPGPGGWAWATRDGRQASGGAPRTTNQRMEVQAALEAVRALDGTVVVVSDSTYVVNCFRDGWWRGWLARGWLTSAKKPVANQDLWEPLITTVRDRGDVTFRWVKGHSGDVMNDLVDRLAVAAAAAER